MVKTLSLDPSAIAIATTTLYAKWYKGKRQSTKHTDKVRGDLALKFIKDASDKGLHVVVVDGKSAKTFHKEISSIPNIVVLKRIGEKRSPTRRQAIKAASKISGVKVIVLTEPEKTSLLLYLHLVMLPLLRDEADVVIPKREHKHFFRSYPRYMYNSEIEGNSFYNEALKSYGFLEQEKENLDLFFGPRVFQNKKSIISLFMKKYYINPSGLSVPSEYFDTEQYSNTLFFPIVLALKKKLRVQSVTIPFMYPKEQKENEEKGARELFIDKRKAQRLSILVELLYFISYLSKNRNSRVKALRKKK